MKRTNKNTILKIILRILCVPVYTIVGVFVFPYYVITGKDLVKTLFERYYHYYMRSDWTEKELESDY